MSDKYIMGVTAKAGNPAVRLLSKESPAVHLAEIALLPLAQARLYLVK